MKGWVKRAKDPIRKTKGPRDMEMWASEPDRKGRTQARKAEAPAPVKTKMVQPKKCRGGRTQQDVVSDYNRMKDSKKGKRK